MEAIGSQVSLPGNIDGVENSVLAALWARMIKIHHEKCLESFWRESNLHLPPWKHQKTGGFLMLSGVTEVEHWLKIG